MLAALTGLLAFFANDAGVLDVKVAVPQSKAAKRSLNLELDADTLEADRPWRSQARLLSLIAWLMC